MCKRKIFFRESFHLFHLEFLGIVVSSLDQIFILKKIMFQKNNSNFPTDFWYFKFKLERDNYISTIFSLTLFKIYVECMSELEGGNYILDHINKYRRNQLICPSNAFQSARISLQTRLARASSIFRRLLCNKFKYES